MKLEDDLYKRLNVDRKATTAEIVAAYHASRSAFAKDSLAAYSLLGEEESAKAIVQLEEAYLVLTNTEKRIAYDQTLSKVDQTNPAQMAGSMATAPSPAISDPAPSGRGGEYLRKIRESRGLTPQDVSKVTKIPIRFLEAIEQNREGDLPARVYLQGFIKNLSQFYKIDSKKTLDHYMTSLPQH